MALVSPTSTTTIETITTATAFDGLAGEWDELVRAMPRPSPFLLHGWLSEWWRHYCDGLDLAVQVARRDGRLVAALPVVVRRRAGLRIAVFMGGRTAVLPDLLIAPDAPSHVAAELTTRVDADVADFHGLPRGSRIADALGPRLGTDRAHRGAGPGSRRRLGSRLSRQDQRQEAQPAPTPASAARRAGDAHGRHRARARRARARPRGGVPAPQPPLGRPTRRVGLRERERRPLPARGYAAAGGAGHPADHDAEDRRPGDRVPLLVRARGPHVRPPPRLRSRAVALLARAW